MPASTPCTPRTPAAGDNAAAAAATATSASCCCGRGSSFSVAAPLAMTKTPAGVHLAANVPPCLALVELSSELAVGQTGGIDDDATRALAHFVTYHRDGNEHAPSAPHELTVYHSLARRSAGVPIGPVPLTEGDRAWAYFNAQSGRWELVQPPSLIWRFELDGALSPGGSATAKLVAWNGASWAPTGSTFTVFDSLGNLSGSAGSRGVAHWFGDSNRWEIVQIDTCCAEVE